MIQAIESQESFNRCRFAVPIFSKGFGSIFDQGDTNSVRHSVQYHAYKMHLLFPGPREWTWKGVDEMRETLAELNMKITMFLHSDLEFIFILEGN